MSDPLEDARNYLRQALGALMEVSDQRRWQPIETAPKDGTKILVADVRGNIFAALWHDEENTDIDAPGWIDGARDKYEMYITFIDVTHWMTLPEPPK